MLQPVPGNSTPPPPTSAEDFSLAPRRLYALLYKHKLLILACVTLAAAGTFFWTKRLQPVYQADCTIEYDSEPLRPLGRDIEDVSPSAQYWGTREFLGTQNLVLTSRSLAERVVRRLGLQNNADFMLVLPPHDKGWKGASVTEAAQLLQSRIGVEPQRDTRVVHIRVNDPNPERATLLANTIADAYIEKALEDRLGSTSSALEWLSKQLDDLKQRLEQTELSLHEFVEQQANLTMPFEEQQRLVSADIGRFSTRLSEARMERIEQAAKVKSLESARGVGEGPVGPTEGDTVVRLRAKYLDIISERDAAAVKYGEEHPQIKALDARITAIRAELQREVDATLADARSDLIELQEVEKGVTSLLGQANKQGLDLSLEEITFRRLQRERDNAAKLYGTILQRTAETDLSHALNVSYVRVLDRALPPMFPIYPNYRQNLTIGTVLGLALGIGLALLLALLDRVIRTVEDAEAMGLTMLGLIPRIEQDGRALGPTYGRGRKKREALPVTTDRDMVVNSHPKSSVAECCRTIRTNLMFMSADRPQRALVVTSAGPREGKTTVTISLAISLAQSGKRLLLVDTDLRRPRIHRAFGVSNGRGVTSLLVGECTVEQAVQHSRIPGVDVLASGPVPPNPAELLHSSPFRELVSELRRRYDMVLFDSPPLGAVTDAAVIAPQVDGALLVVHSRETTRDVLRSALRQLNDVGAHVTGGVLNDVDLSQRAYGYGSYYYYRQEGYSEEPDRSRDAPAAEG